MMTEWYFLFSILVMDPSQPDGFLTTRYSVSAPSLDACEAKKEEVYQKYRLNPIIGGALVVTGCQPRAKQPD